MRFVFVEVLFEFFVLLAGEVLVGVDLSFRTELLVRAGEGGLELKLCVDVYGNILRSPG